MAEVLPTLQQRRRWTREQREVKPGDVVLMAEPDSPRSSWPLARVLQSLPSRDGLIRKVRIVSGGRELERPVHRLVMLVRQTAANSEHSQPPARQPENGVSRRRRGGAAAATRTTGLQMEIRSGDEQTQPRAVRIASSERRPSRRRECPAATRWRKRGRQGRLRGAERTVVAGG